MKVFIERLKICYYALTKKYYAFYAIDKFSVGHSGAKCYISEFNERKYSEVFLGSILDHIKTLIKE